MPAQAGIQYIKNLDPGIRRDDNIGINMHIAVLEDDSAQAELLQSWLTKGGHDCTLFGLGKVLIESLAKDSFDLLILDWNLPDINGTDVLAWVRKNMDWHIPVIFITCRDAEQDVVHALELGADDYMAKPAKQYETLARVTALERRSQPHSDKSGILELYPYCFNTQSGTVTCHDESVQLTRKEFDLALFFFKNIGQLLSRTTDCVAN
jgi:DNA-binding response OmpR family regulator